MPSNRRSRTSRRRQPRSPHPAYGPPPASEPPVDDTDLLLGVHDALEASGPLDLLAFASTLLAAIDDDRLTGGAPADRDPTVHGLVGTFIDLSRAETTGLLAVLAELLDDELLERRIRRELDNRPHRLPAWLADLRPVTVTRAVEMGHVLGDGENVALDVRTGSDATLAVMVYVDHNLGTVAKDAMVVDEPLEALVASFAEAAGDDPDVRIADLDPAAARARLEEAIDRWSGTDPVLETDTWPAARAIVEWVLRAVPPGGTGYARPVWTDADRAALARRFLHSPHGRAHTGADEPLLHLLLAAVPGTGDPLRWSPVVVEIVLADRLPTALGSDVDPGRVLPLLRDLVRFAHAERNVSATLTDETLAAVDRFAPEFRRLVTLGRQDPAALLDDVGLPWLTLDDGTSVRFGELMLDGLRAAVGGAQALEELDTRPLPDEPLDIAAVAPDVRDRVEEIGGLADAACTELLDVEHRTACRRLLADIAAADPHVFRRRGRVDTAAAALTWIVARANDSLGSHRGGLTVKRLNTWFRISNAPQRAGTLLRALDVPPASSPELHLGTPRYLVAARRQALTAARDQYSDLPF